MPLVSVDNIRLFLLDNIDNAELLEDIEFKDQEIEDAIELFINKINAIVPMTTFTKEDLHEAFKYPVIVGASSILLNARAAAQLRNQISFQDQGRSVGLHDKFQLYKQFSNDLRAEADKMTADLKQQINMSAGFDSLSSEYVWDYFRNRFKS